MQTSLFLAFLTALMLHVVGLAVMSFGWQAWRESWPRPEPLATTLIAVTPVPEPTPPPPPESPPEPVSIPDVDSVPEPVPATPPLSAPIAVPTQVQPPPQSRRSLVRNLRQSRRHNLPSCRQRANAPRVLHQCSAKPRPVHRQVSATNPWGVLAVDRPGHPQPQPRQSRQRLSLLPLLRERVLGHCLPMAICQWRQALVAAGGEGTGGGRARAGTGEGAGGGTGPGRGGGSGHGTGSGSGISARPIGGYQVKPRYPESARRRGIEGTVLLKMRITAQGRVEDVQVVRSAGYPELDESAMEAVRRWRFEPARRNGAPVAEDAVLLPVVFQLQ